ncbi:MULTISPECIES: Card1-like endonuclease domain-containing protein [Tenacibaculum]|uniref:Card1-like endonuclease domain-containing protein n=1 Tax=Tenacibaculum TaxID=104267 RepID=UPI00064AA120|nr:DUF1887 family CARF protein [Tenacibaculum mesophilum]
MIRQITLLGGQPLPVFWGIKEKSPNVVHILYTKETREAISPIQKQFNGIKFNPHQIDPYDFKGIKELVENIVFENEKDNFQLNLTSGTKVMALACQSVFKSLELDVFYIDQKNRIFNLNEEEFTPLNSTLKIKTSINLSGHQDFTSNKLADYSKEEKELAHKVLQLTTNNSGIKALFKNVRNTDIKVDTCKNFNKYGVVWKNDKLKINLSNHTITAHSKIAFKIVFGGLWWEILIAEVTKKWSKCKEQLMSVSIQTKKNQNLTKNEIDIVLNTGQNMILIECKSGNVTQADINKIRTVKRLYGGISSKSILICRYTPRKDILEKCNDLGIDVFSYQTNSKKGKLISLKKLDDINKKLDQLINKLNI